MSSFFLLKLVVGPCHFCRVFFDPVLSFPCHRHRRPFVANVNDSGIQDWVASDVVLDSSCMELRESKGFTSCTMHVGEAVVITYIMDRKQVPGYTTKAQKFLNRWALILAYPPPPFHISARINGGSNCA